MKKVLLVLLGGFASAAFAKFDYAAAVTAALNDDGRPLVSTVWQAKHAAELAEGTSEATIDAIVRSPRAARALLAKVRGAYVTEALAAYQIAEATHYVMVDADSVWYEFWREHRDVRRRIWTEALLQTAVAAKDDYVKIFCLDQLRWCATSDQVDAIRRLGDDSACRGLRDFAVQVADELAGPGRIGL